MKMERVTRYIEENYSGKVVEIGIGGMRDVADTLDSNPEFDVVVTDVRDIETGLEFFKDDIMDPDIGVYDDANLIYSIRPPYEIHGALDDVARKVGSDLLIVPLSGEETDVDHELVNYEGRTMHLVKNG